MADNEVKIGDKVIGENTKISFSVKTALWIIGGLFVLFSSILTATYFKSQSDMKLYKKEIEDNNAEFLRKIETKIDSKFDKQDIKNDKFIEDMTQMRINIQQLLDRTQGIQPNINNEHIKINENAPSNQIPTTKDR